MINNLEIIRNFKYIDLCGYFINLNGVDRFFVFVENNPYVLSLFRLYKKEFDYTGKEKFIMITSTRIHCFNDLNQFKRFLEYINIKEKDIDFLIDIYKIHSENRVVKFDEKPIENVQNKQKKRSNFFTFCRKLLKG